MEDKEPRETHSDDNLREYPAAVASLSSADRTMYHYGSLVIALLLICTAVYCRIRLLDMPLERDEGGFAYIGQQLLRGIAPYHSGNMKILPGIHFAYAGIMMMFGETASGIRTGLLVVNSITILIIYCMARRMLTMEGAAIAAGTYAILSVGQSVFGITAHATHFVNLFVLAGLLALLAGFENNRRILYFICGLCLGTSVLMKQHGLFFCLFVYCYVIGRVVADEKRFSSILLQRLAVLTAGLVIPYAAIIVYMCLNGVFKEFWFWTVTLSLDYATAINSVESVSLLSAYFDYMSINVKLFLIVALIGLTLAVCTGKYVKRRWFVVSLLFFSVLAILPGFSFYPHYFIVMLPPLSLLTGIAFESLPRISGREIDLRTARVLVLLSFLALTIFTLYNRSEYLFARSPYSVSRLIYGMNPFPESREVGRYIRENSAFGTRIAVIGSEPQIYFYADRPSATDYLYMYPLVEQQPYALTMQREMILEIDLSAPEYIVLVSVSMSWMLDDAVETPLFAWIEDYLQENYRRVGVVDMVGEAGSEYFWNEDAERYLPSSMNYILVYEKKSVSFS